MHTNNSHNSEFRYHTSNNSLRLSILFREIAACRNAVTTFTQYTRCSRGKVSPTGWVNSIKATAMSSSVFSFEPNRFFPAGCLADVVVNYIAYKRELLTARFTKELLVWDSKVFPWMLLYPLTRGDRLRTNRSTPTEYPLSLRWGIIIYHALMCKLRGIRSL